MTCITQRVYQDSYNNSKLSEMHETFKIIEPYLNENGIRLKSRRFLSPPGVQSQTAFIDNTLGGKLTLKGSVIIAPGGDAFDLHHPSSLENLVKYLKKWYALKEWALIYGPPLPKQAE